MKLKNILMGSAIMSSELFALDTNASDKTTIKTAKDANVSESIQSSVEVVDQLSEYSSLITHSLYFIIFGVFIIYILHKLVSKFIYPYLRDTRIIKVLFGALYAMILVVSVLMVLKQLGFDVKIIGKISILSVLVGAVAIFFLLPFLPRLPFKIGHMVEINGVMGEIDNISTYHTTIRKFDGTMVFMPNAKIMTSTIMNYHDVPVRRIEMHLTISADSNIEEVKKQLSNIISDDERVLKDPAPSMYITGVEARGLSLSAYCWVENGDWLNARSDLFAQVQNTFMQNDNIALARTQQEVFLMDKIG